MPESPPTADARVDAPPLWEVHLVAWSAEQLEQRVLAAQRSLAWRRARRLQRLLDRLRRRPTSDGLETVRAALRELRHSPAPPAVLLDRVRTLAATVDGIASTQTYRLAHRFVGSSRALCDVQRELATLAAALESGTPPPEARRALEAATGRTYVDVVIPVYGNREETLRCIDSVLASSCRTPYELVVIDDASPDPELIAALEKRAADGRITLLRNPVNIGFTGTANRGLALHRDRDVVLLNSDTEVHGDWLDRLRSAAYADWRVGTVTPFSNNAEICSYPELCRPNPLPADCSVGRLDALFATANAGIAYTLPTAVGFCMYARRACLDEVGIFDEARFPRGYGEENDLCMRARAAGWRNVLAADTFVLHAGGISFGAEKDARVPHAVQRVAERHPTYLRDVHDWIASDPAFTARRRVDLLRLRDDRPAVLLASHAQGGGTERHVRELSDRLASAGLRVLVLRPAGGPRVAIDSYEVTGLANARFDLPREYGALVEALRDLDVRHVHVHHWIGFPPEIDDLASDLGVEYDVTLHDYFVVCPRVHVVDGSGRYCGIPEARSCQRCVASHGSELGPEVDVESHRRRYGELLQGARRVFVPSADVERRLTPHVPRVRFAVRPHFETWAGVRRVVAERRAGEPLRVAVIGAIGPHKGSAVLEACLRDADRRSLAIRFVLVGYSDRDLDLLRSPRAEVTGAYDDADLFDLLAERRCQLAFFPSVWPETHCFALSAALLGGLRPVSFDLGAQGDRTAARADGILLPLTADACEINDALLAIESDRAGGAALDPPPTAAYPDFWRDYYGEPFALDAPRRDRGTAAQRR